MFYLPSEDDVGVYLVASTLRLGIGVIEVDGSSEVAEARQDSGYSLYLLLRWEYIPEAQSFITRAGDQSLAIRGGGQIEDSV